MDALYDLGEKPVGASAVPVGSQVTTVVVSPFD
jgi:hypothetical protein